MILIYLSFIKKMSIFLIIETSVYFIQLILPSVTYLTLLLLIYNIMVTQLILILIFFINVLLLLLLLFLWYFISIFILFLLFPVLHFSCQFIIKWTPLYVQISFFCSTCCHLVISFVNLIMNFILKLDLGSK